MYKVKRAIIMAAGIGKRMQPVTLETPKPLVKVNGVRMIDTVIQGLLENGISEIYVQRRSAHSGGVRLPADHVPPDVLPQG